MAEVVRRADDNGDDLHLAAVAVRRVGVEIRVDPVRPAIGAVRREARVAGVRIRVRTGRHGRDERFRRSGAHHVLLVDGVRRPGGVGDRAVPLAGRLLDVGVLDPAEELHLRVGERGGGRGAARSAECERAGVERGDDREDADVQHRHRH